MVEVGSDSYRQRWYGIIFLLTVAAHAAVAQQPTPTPLSEDIVRVRTDEVTLTIYAQGPFPGVLPKLRPDDITVYEDGIPQKIASMRVAPANVLLLLDTGAALSFAKSDDSVRLAADIAVTSLPADASVSVVQYSDQPETVVPWTNKREEVIAAIDSSVKMGRRSLLANAVLFAIQSFAERPIENRHLILVTDGLDNSSAIGAQSAEMKQLAAANITVHILSYAAIEQIEAARAARTVRINTQPTRARIPKEIFDEMLRGLPLPIKVKEFLRLGNEAQRIVIINLDIEQKKMLRSRRVEWEKAQRELDQIALETGGVSRSPTDLVNLAIAAAQIARSIGSHYTITYSPTRPVSEITSAESRSVSVKSQSDLIFVRTRRSINLLTPQLAR